MDVFYAYTYSTAGWLSLQSISLITVPQIMTTLLLDESRSASELEIYFARCLGFSLLTIAVLTVMLTGSIPLNSTVSEPVTTEDNDPKGPYAIPTLIVTALFQGFSAFYAYTRYLSSGHTAFAIGMIGYSVVAAIGLWCALFASSNGKISRKTGADKRTTGFPFKNTEAAKKHAWKKSS
ncbi:hypothetical protein F9C07_2226439 [Aspergillus flavus]|uniref:Uncharacterized protein n=5 Tax=Aspergillus subgen. Circumdati TaxID=2720871 RepID=B8N107_ASPFN|nr:uncharacterized protein G4B84_003707 [Aspergillus flavus NRRL3357]KAB8250859.1 hypothetical protein BDV35DRAFT_388614 [Aspergillus flavus]KOC17415.1 hypothetical protein AFLA70_10g006121 [Aspergillus flavus AF70]OOO09973.1 hypothetical protein OAory_01057810 [Aspergillus oryzae]KAF7618991.1 hypothetical protein AFLA_000634 [Aspergillus flavus NRRL3357]KAJ1706454.1 hypothetical protein NYO67_11387 [Aspergillus flavus]